MFLGYSLTRKGYKLHNLLTGVFVSRDVKFYESIYPFHVFYSVTTSKAPNHEIIHQHTSSSVCDGTDERDDPKRNYTEEDTIKKKLKQKLNQLLPLLKGLVE